MLEAVSRPVRAAYAAYVARSWCKLLGASGYRGPPLLGFVSVAAAAVDGGGGDGDVEDARAWAGGRLRGGRSRKEESGGERWLWLWLLVLHGGESGGESGDGRRERSDRHRPR